MTEFNSYPVFVADQVLMADHLNEIVNYLDEQDRLTRNKLIGIGIVCGLELKVTSAQIKVTKGCGVTSAGYLIVQDELNLSYYTPYALPSDFFPKYKPVYENWHMWQLLTAEQSLEVDDSTSIESDPSFMKDKIVVLLLEMKEKPLKNCVDTDCDDKGDKIEFAIKPLLVLKADIDKFLKSHEGPIVVEPKATVEPVLHDLQLRRYNVPVSELTSSDLVLNAFLELVTEPQLKRLSEVLNYCYVHYKPILFEETANPFQNVFEVLKERLSAIKNTNPFFIQYYYDWVDDIIKAYYEFKSKVFDVQVMCCPDDDLFPLHLMLGEATKSTPVDLKAKYRHYFLYSPLFNQQKELLSEVQLLFRRLKLLIEKYVIPNPNTFANTLIKITPSKYLDRPLSDRCIPYYYNPLDLYKSWSWSKTRKGNARYNLSYNSNLYNSADAIVNPLLYDIERFNFFRVEGHIGKSYAQALTNIIGQRDKFNLPFEVVALSTTTVARFVAADDRECLFKDLESLYKVIVAELICKFGELACLVANVPFRFSFSSDNIAGVSTGNMEGEIHHFTKSVYAEAEKYQVNETLSSSKSNILASLLGLSFVEQPVYKKGDFLQEHCTIRKGTVGEIYLALVKQGHAFVRPAPSSEPSLGLVYAHFFYFLDCVENVMGASWPYELKNFDPKIFNSRFSALTMETRFIADGARGIIEIAKELELEDMLRRFPPLTQTCFDERLTALKKEYLKRYQEIQLLTNFMNYFKKHPGIEHKAGVPKGGTFILVYHETPRRTKKPAREMVMAEVPGEIRENVKYKEGILSEANIHELIKEAAVKDTTLLKNFHLALTQYLRICKDMDDDTKDEITDILVSIPPVLAPTKFRIPDYAVIADFYVPYLCCSDCSPIAFVVPKIPDAVLSIGITPTEFCNNDEKSYKVDVSPEGGSLSASKGGIEQGSRYFKPKDLDPGTHTLTYTLPDGRSAKVDVKVTKPSGISFKARILLDGVTVEFYTGDFDKLLWDFGDGMTSDEKQPTHEYVLEKEKQDFVVKLSVTEGPCFTTAEQTITLEKVKQPVFDISPKVFSAKDTKSYDFDIYPIPGSTTEIENPLGLKMERNADGIFSFIPAKQEVTETMKYSLLYHGMPLEIQIVVPDAEFTMQLKDSPNMAGSGVVMALEARNKKAVHYGWALAQGNVKADLQGVKVSVAFLRKFDIDQPLSVKLTTQDLINGVAIEESKEFIITPEIFQKYMDGAPFESAGKLKRPTKKGK